MTQIKYVTMMPSRKIHIETCINMHNKNHLIVIGQRIAQRQEQVDHSSLGNKSKCGLGGNRLRSQSVGLASQSYILYALCRFRYK